MDDDPAQRDPSRRPRRRQGHPGRAHRGGLQAAARLHRRDAARGRRQGHRDGPRGAEVHAERRARPGRGRDRRRPRAARRAGRRSGDSSSTAFRARSPQAEALDAMLAESGRSITHVVLIDVPAEELVQRIAGRRIVRRVRQDLQHRRSIRPRPTASATSTAASSPSAPTTTKKRCATASPSTRSRRRRSSATTLTRACSRARSAAASAGRSVRAGRSDPRVLMHRTLSDRSQVGRRDR